MTKKQAARLGQIQQAKSKTEKVNLLFSIYEGGRTWPELVKEVAGIEQTGYTRSECREDIASCLSQTRGVWSGLDDVHPLAGLPASYVDQCYGFIRDQMIAKKVA